MRTGTPIFDGLAVMELQANFLSPTVSLTAKAAFVNSQTGSTHGSTTAQQWSTETINRLKLLREAMEEDLSQIHFAEGAGAEYGVSRKAPGGLSENLDHDESGVPQAAGG